MTRHPRPLRRDSRRSTLINAAGAAASGWAVECVLTHQGIPALYALASVAMGLLARALL